MNEGLVPKERIFRKTFEIIERTDLPSIDEKSPMTNKRYVKRGCRTVRERAYRYKTILKKKYGVTKEIPLEQAKRIFQEEMGIWDRTSIKAYFGTQETHSERTIHRIAHYATGTQSHKKIELTQKIQPHEGYLERLGLVSFEKRGPTWFLLIEPESILPEIFRHIKPESECYKAQVNMENFSLAPIATSTHDNECEPINVNVEIVEDREERECIGGERNRRSVKVIGKTPLTNINESESNPELENALRILEASSKESGNYG